MYKIVQEFVKIFSAKLLDNLLEIWQFGNLRGTVDQNCFYSTLCPTTPLAGMAFASKICFLLTVIFQYSFILM